MKTTSILLALLLAGSALAVSPAWVRRLTVYEIEAEAANATDAQALARGQPRDRMRLSRQYYVASTSKPTGAAAASITNVAKDWAAYPALSVADEQFGYVPGDTLRSIGRGDHTYLVFVTEEDDCPFPDLAAAQNFVSTYYAPHVPHRRGMTFDEWIWSPDRVYPSGSAIAVDVAGWKSSVQAAALPWEYWVAQVQPTRRQTSTTRPGYSVPVDIAVLDAAPAATSQIGSTP